MVEQDRREAYFFGADDDLLEHRYRVAVSLKVMPSSIACWKNGWTSHRPSDHSLKPRDVSPKLMHLRA